jgi:hypothetical protein
MANATGEMPRHIAAAHRDAVDNMMFSQRQQLAATNYAIIVYAAIFLVSANFFSRNDTVRALLGLLTGLTFLYHLYMLRLFQDAITSSRSRLAWIYKTYFTREEQAGLDLSLEPKPYLYQAFVWLGLVAVSIVGAGLTEIYLFSVR